MKPSQWREAPNTRAVAFVTMAPRGMASEEDLALKRRYFEEGRHTTHEPHQPLVHEYENEGYGDGTRYRPQLGDLTALGKALAGF